MFSVCSWFGLQSHSDQLRKASQAGQGKEPSCALWIALMVGETGRTGGKKSVCLCVCMWKSLQLQSRPSLLFRESGKLQPEWRGQVKS